MRTVAVAFMAAVILHVPGPILSRAMTGRLSPTLPGYHFEYLVTASAAEPATGAESTGNSSPFHAEQFVYVSPPAQKVTDPRFYADTYQYVPNTGGKSGGLLVQPVYGIVPLSSFKYSSAPTAVHSGKALATPTPVVPKPVSMDSTTNGEMAQQISTAPQVVTKPASGMSVAVKTTGTATPSQVVATSALTPTPVISGQLINADDIEDPRFYRGSYVFDPETRTLKSGVVDEAPSIAAKPAKTPSGVSTSSSGQECAKCGSYDAPESRSSFPRTGRAMYYNPGIMDIVLSFRLESGHVTRCTECVGYAALLGGEDLNRHVWIEWNDGAVEGPFLVIDAAAKHHVASLLQRNWVIDVDYDTAMRHGMNRPLPVTVWDHRPGPSDAAGGN